MRLLAAVVTMALCACALGAESEWVHFDQSGKLVYKKLESGERILDFSFAGYGGGGVKIPTMSHFGTRFTRRRSYRAPEVFNRSSTRVMALLDLVEHAGSNARVHEHPVAMSWPSPTASACT
jgi:hypothetical protein